MTIPSSTAAPPNVPGQAAGDTATGDTKESMKQTAATAADQGKHVAAVAQEEAKTVLDETKTQAQALLSEAQTQLEEQTRSQRDRLVQTLQTFGQDLEKMAAGQGADSGIAQDLVRQVSSQVRDFTSRLDGREPQQLLSEVRSFARRRPGTFLVGAVAAGLVTGRLSRGAIDAKREGGSSSDSTSTGTSAPAVPDPGIQGTAAGAPLSGTPRPHGDPVYPDGTTGSGTLP